MTSLRLAIVGTKGQVARALIQEVPADMELISLGRPQLDLIQRESVVSTLENVRCDAIINAAAYTYVDRAEDEVDLAIKVNGDGAGYIAQAANELHVPLIHISTDYVFDGLSVKAYTEKDPTNPINVYGLSKLIGEQKITEIHANHAILRTSWVYSPFGHNFVKTMLSIATQRDEVSVVSDQKGCPTSAIDFARAIYVIAHRLVIDNSSDLRGVFNLTGNGDAAWSDVAIQIFETRSGIVKSEIKVRNISSTDYPTKAKRPHNSTLDNTKIKKLYDIQLPNWRQSVNECVNKIMSESDKCEE